MTGAGMMECKKALAEAEGDMEKAVDVLRTRGLAAVAKKAGRATNEGTVMALVSDCGMAGARRRAQLRDRLRGHEREVPAPTLRRSLRLLSPPSLPIWTLSRPPTIEGETVEAIVTDAIHTLGENIQLSRFALIDQPEGAVASYIHGGGKIGVLVDVQR